jgi:hypothetical protein
VCGDGTEPQGHATDKLFQGNVALEEESADRCLTLPGDPVRRGVFSIGGRSRPDWNPRAAGDDVLYCRNDAVVVSDETKGRMA